MTEVRIRLTFPEVLIREPIIAKLASEHGVVPNIRRANVDESEGWIVCEIGGPAPAVEAAISWLEQQGVRVDLLGGDMVES